MQVVQPPKLLTVDDVAAALRCSRGSVYRHVRRGVLPALRVGEGGQLRFEPDALEQLLRPAHPTHEETT